MKSSSLLLDMASIVPIAVPKVIAVVGKPNGGKGSSRVKFKGLSQSLKRQSTRTVRVTVIYKSFRILASSTSLKLR